MCWLRWPRRRFGAGKHAQTRSGESAARGRTRCVGGRTRRLGGRSASAGLIDEARRGESELALLRGHHQFPGLSPPCGHDRCCWSFCLLTTATRCCRHRAGPPRIAPLIGAAASGRICRAAHGAWRPAKDCCRRFAPIHASMPRKAARSGGGLKEISGGLPKEELVKRLKVRGCGRICGALSMD